MTDFEDIYDLALMKMKDYRLDNLAVTNYEGFLNYLRGLLVSGLGEFSGCLNDLSYTSRTEEGVTKYYFNADLTVLEKDILSEIIAYNWFQQNNNDILVYKNKMTVKEFKNLEISSGLKARVEYLDKWREKIHQKISQYQLSNFSSVFGESW